MNNRYVKYGLITGIIIALWVIIWGVFIPVDPEGSGMSYGLMEILGFLSMFLGFITIFLANFKQIYDEDDSKFWPLLRSGLIISVVASIIYTASWMTVYEANGSEKIDALIVMQEKDVMASDLSEAKKAERIEYIHSSMEGYKNNVLIRLGVTLSEILPFGILLSLLSSGIFYLIGRKRRKDLALE